MRRTLTLGFLARARGGRSSRWRSRTAGWTRPRPFTMATGLRSRRRPALENLNPAARPRRPHPSPATPAPTQPAPTQPASEPTQSPIEARRAPAPVQPAPAPTVPAQPHQHPPSPHASSARSWSWPGIDRYLEDLARSAQGDLARLAWSTREPSAAWSALVPVFRRDVLAAATAAALARRLETEHLPAAARLAALHRAPAGSGKPSSRPPSRRITASTASSWPASPTRMPSSRTCPWSSSSSGQGAARIATSRWSAPCGTPCAARSPRWPSASSPTTTRRKRAPAPRSARASGS